MKVRFGGPDARAIRMLESFGRGFYLSPLIDDSDGVLIRHIRKNYLEKGAALFGRGTPEQWAAFRRAARGRLKGVDDDEIETIIQYAVQRLRNYAHILSLRDARIDSARITMMGGQGTQICALLQDKTFSVRAAAHSVERFTTLSPEEFAFEQFQSDTARRYIRNPVEYVSTRIRGNRLDDSLIAEGRGFPPFHRRCGCRVEGVVTK